MTSQESFDAELGRWFDRQDPPRHAEHLVEPIMATVAVTDQRSAKPWVGAVLTMAAAAVLVGLILTRGLLTGPVGGPDVPPPPGSTSRMPEGTITIPIKGSRSFEQPLGVVTMTPSTVWVEAWRENVLIDRATNAEIARVSGAYVPAFAGDLVWSFVDSDPDAPTCCPPGILSALDPATGEIQRELPSVTGYRVALDGDFAWVTDDQTLRRVDLASGAVLTTVDLPDGWMEPIVAEGSVWVLGPDSLHRVDPDLGSVIATIEITDPQDVTAGEGGIWVKTNPEGPSYLEEESTLVRVDPATNEVAATLHGFGLQQSFGGLVVADGLVWAASAGGLSRVDPATNGIVDVTTLPWDNYWGIGVDDDEVWLSGDHSHNLYRIPVASIGR
jgi:hypothetical protein